jgi:hypothetical protein
MSDQKQVQHFSPRTTNLLIVASVVILIATLLIRYLAPAAWEAAIQAQTGFSLQQIVLVLMGIGVFLFLLVAFDQPE